MYFFVVDTSATPKFVCCEVIQRTIQKCIYKQVLSRQGVININLQNALLRVVTESCRKKESKMLWTHFLASLYDSTTHKVIYETLQIEG